MNNLLLAFITQEFSLAVNSISRNLKQSINCPRCSFRLCVIQFTRYSRYPLGLRRSPDSLHILAQLFSFVKNFFHFSSNYFRLLYAFGSSPERLHILSDCSQKVKHYFHFFSTFLLTLNLVSKMGSQPKIKHRQRAETNPVCANRTTAIQPLQLLQTTRQPSPSP